MRKPKIKKREMDKTNKERIDWENNQSILARIMYNMKQHGFLDKDIAKVIGVTPVGLAKAKKKYPAIDAAFIEGKADCVQGVIAQLFKSAMGGEEFTEVTEEDFFYRGEKVDKKKKKTTKVTQPNFKAIELILTNLDSETWTKAHQIEHARKKDVVNGKPEADKINRLAGEIFGDDTEEFEGEFDVSQEAPQSPGREQRNAADVSSDMSPDASSDVQDDVLDVSAEDRAE